MGHCHQGANVTCQNSDLYKYGSKCGVASTPALANKDLHIAFKVAPRIYPTNAVPHQRLKPVEICIFSRIHPFIRGNLYN
jgi:hypothetical protein